MLVNDKKLGFWNIFLSPFYVVQPVNGPYFRTVLPNPCVLSGNKPVTGIVYFCLGDAVACFCPVGFCIIKRAYPFIWDAWSRSVLLQPRS